MICIVMSKVQEPSRITSCIANAPAPRLIQPATLIPGPPKGPHHPEALMTEINYFENHLYILIRVLP
jgi:hypothetical protein